VRADLEAVAGGQDNISSLADAPRAAAHAVILVVQVKLESDLHDAVVWRQPVRYGESRHILYFIRVIAALQQNIQVSTSSWQDLESLLTHPAPE
jgi:hypothetical protein